MVMLLSLVFLLACLINIELAVSTKAAILTTAR